MSAEHISIESIFMRTDEFFIGEGPVYKTMRMLAQRLGEKRIEYALAGDMALVLYGYRREAINVDFLLTNDGRDLLEANLCGRGYVPLFPGARKRFQDTNTGVEIDLI